MHCEKCQKKKSTVIYHENLSGRTRTLHLCADCAHVMEQAGELEEMSAAFAAFSSPMLGITDRNLRPGAVMPPIQGDATCSVCGIAAREVSAEGRLGCPSCYEQLANAFHGRLDPPKSYRGRVARHVRVREENRRRMHLLRSQLAEAVRAEQYEQAVTLRDRIRELESCGIQGEVN